MYVCHVDAGHGWLAVKRSELKKLGILQKITSFSYQRGKTVYLEEDCDAGTFMKAKEEKGEEVPMRESYHDYSPIRSYEGFSLRAEDTEDEEGRSKPKGEQTMAKLIKPDGTIEDIQPANGTDFTFQELYGPLDCSMIQICEGKGGKILLFDEEFLCRGDIAQHPTMGICKVGRDENGETTYTPYLNRLATHAMHPSMGPFEHNVVCGNCVVCDSDQLK